MRIMMVHMAMVVLWATLNIDSKYTRPVFGVNTSACDLLHELT